MLNRQGSIIPPLIESHGISSFGESLWTPARQTKRAPFSATGRRPAPRSASQVAVGGEWPGLSPIPIVADAVLDRLGAQRRPHRSKRGFHAQRKGRELTSADQSVIYYLPERRFAFEGDRHERNR